MSTRNNLAVALLMCCPPAVCAAQGGDIVQWMEDRSVEIRKSFVGTTKDAADGAVVTFVDADDGEEFYAIDLAVKTGSWEVLKTNATWQGRFSPVAERHRSTQELGKVNNTSVGLISEFEYELGECVNGTGGTTDMCHALFFDVSAKVKDDSAKNQTTRTTSLTVGLFGKDRAWPGMKLNLGMGQLTYLPTFAIEHYDKLPIEAKIGGQTVVVAQGVSESFESARLNLEYRPAYESLSNRLTLVLNHTQRWLNGSSPVIEHRTNFTEFAVNYFLDAKRWLALGFTYSDGANPERNFLDEETSTFGFKVRVGAK